MTIMLQLAEKASDVRQHFSKFIDSVVRDRPGFMTRNRDTLATLNYEHLVALTKPLRFHASIQQDENGDFIATLEEIDDLVAVGANVDEALTVLAQDLMEYAQEYWTDSFRVYFNAPNRRDHFPYVFKIAMQNSVDDVKRLINA